MKIELHVANLGPVPAFKNKKRAILDKGKLRTLTDPKTKKWMDHVTENFVLLLSSVTPTTAGVTLTAEQRRSLIASSLPLDDSRQWISQLLISDQQVNKGDEGATITIEPI